MAAIFMRRDYEFIRSGSPRCLPKYFTLAVDAPVAKRKTRVFELTRARATKSVGVAANRSRDIDVDVVAVSRVD
jgi:uncharacterized ferredoxin-like protein